MQVGIFVIIIFGCTCGRGNFFCNFSKRKKNSLTLCRHLGAQYRTLKTYLPSAHEFPKCNVLLTQRVPAVGGPRGVPVHPVSSRNPRVFLHAAGMHCPDKDPEVACKGRLGAAVVSCHLDGVGDSKDHLDTASCTDHLGGEEVACHPDTLDTAHGNTDHLDMASCTDRLDLVVVFCHLDVAPCNKGHLGAASCRGRWDLAVGVFCHLEEVVAAFGPRDMVAGNMSHRHRAFCKDHSDLLEVVFCHLDVRKGVAGGHRDVVEVLFFHQDVCNMDRPDKLFCNDHSKDHADKRPRVVCSSLLDRAFHKGLLRACLGALLLVDDCHLALEDNRPLLLVLGRRRPSKAGLYSVNMKTLIF